MNRQIVAALTAIVLSLAVVGGGYQLGWWLKEDGVNRNAEIRQDSFERQNSLADMVRDDISELALAGDVSDGVRISVIAGICENAAQLTDTGSDMLGAVHIDFIEKECS